MKTPFRLPKPVDQYACIQQFIHVFEFIL